MRLKSDLVMRLHKDNASMEFCWYLMASQDTHPNGSHYRNIALEINEKYFKTKE